MTETINGLHKVELIHRRSWRNLPGVTLTTLGDIPLPEGEAV